MKKIVSFTTIPSRIKFVEPVVKSILNQTIEIDEIHVQIPEFSSKEECYYEIPSFFKKYPKLKVVNHKKDEGSASKWYFPIQYLKDEEDTLLFIIDDDCTYQNNSIKKLFTNVIKDKSKCYAFTGGMLPRLPEKYKKFTVASHSVKDSLTIIENNSDYINVDVVQGFSMYAVLPVWFKKFDFSIFKEGLSDYCDDMLLSSVLEYLSIEKVQIGPYMIPDILPQSEINPIHGDGRLTLKSMQTLMHTQEKLSIWSDVRVELPPPRRLLSLRLIWRKIKSRLKSY